MKTIVALLILILPFAVQARTEMGCYFSGLVGKGESDTTYLGGELGCEASTSKTQWLGGYADFIFLDPKGNNITDALVGINLGVRKNFKFVSFSKYRHWVPYITFGGIVFVTGERLVEDGGQEYQNITDLTLHAFVPSVGVKIPISSYISLVPSLRYLSPLRKEDDSMLTIGLSFHFALDNKNKN